MEYDARNLGGGDFVEEILGEAEQRVKRYLPARERGALVARIIQETCKEEGVREREMRVGGQARRVSRVRARIAWILSRE